MSTTEETMTAEDHIREAERFAAAAEEHADATAYEHVVRRGVDLQAAQVHATLAQTLKAAELMPLMTRMVEWLEQPQATAPGDAPETSP